MAERRGQDIVLEAQGRQAQAYIAGADRRDAPGVLVLHAWWGLTPFFKGLCDRLAGEGFVALAPNLFGDKTARTIDEARSLMHLEHDEPEWFQAEALEALDRLRTAAPRAGLGIVGFSMGTYWASLLSTLRPDEVRAVVLYYGTGGADFSRSKADFLGHFAETDEYESADDVRALESALRKAGREVTLYTYPGTGHWFFEDNQPNAFDPQAAQLSWERTLDFLRGRLKPAG